MLATCFYIHKLNSHPFLEHGENRTAAGTVTCREINGENFKQWFKSSERSWALRGATISAIESVWVEVGERAESRGRRCASARSDLHWRWGSACVASQWAWTPCCGWARCGSTGRCRWYSRSLGSPGSSRHPPARRERTRDRERTEDRTSLKSTLIVKRKMDKWRKSKRAFHGDTWKRTVTRWLHQYTQPICISKED